MSIYKPVFTTVTLADSTPTEVRLPEGSKGHLFRTEQDIVWRVAGSSASADSGMPFDAPETLSIGDPVQKSSLWFYQESGLGATLHWAYLIPSVR
jgi:hypothetical protein